MGKYQMNMAGEIERVLLDEGWQDFEIVKVEEGVSQSNNLKFTIKFSLANMPTVGLEQNFTAIEGKRWLLKQLLRSCDCPAGEDGVYDWSPEDIEGHTVSGRIEHEDREFINRDSKTVKFKQAKIVEFRKLQVK